MSGIDIIFVIAIVVMSVVIHEVSHGYVAFILGDKTAHYEGRLTLNPLKHLDPVGSVIVPILTYLSTGVSFGWAKPVPYNPYNLRNQRWGEAWVAAAGPLSNILIATIFGLALRFGADTFSASLIQIASLIVLLNIGLACFNLVPIPPLDGSKILFAFLPYRWRGIREALERYSLILVIVFVFFLSWVLSPLIFNMFYLITGFGI